MEKQHRMAQIYGYTVCLVAVITFIICISSIIPSIMDLSDPLHAGGLFQFAATPSLASYDNYKMDILKSENRRNKKPGQIISRMIKLFTLCTKQRGLTGSVKLTIHQSGLSL
jgi:hypothetical protein